MLPNIPASRTRRMLAVLLVLAVSSRAEDEAKPETNVPVSVGQIVRTTLRRYVSAYGTVEPAPSTGIGQPAGGAKLAASSPGLVIAVAGIEGTRVEKGAVLVQLDARAADAAVAKAQAAVGAADKARTRQTRLQAAEGTSERALQEAEAALAAARSELAAAQLQQSQLTIRAPLAGTLARLAVKPGEWLEAGREVAQVIDLDRLAVVAQVPAEDARAIRPGQPASMLARLVANEKPIVDGSVQFVSPEINPANDGVLVRIAIPAASTLRPGQFVAVRIAVEERPDCLAVPVESIFIDDGTSTLALVDNGRATRKTVQTGLRDGDLIEVRGEGLSAGATVVTAGAYGLPKETAVTVRKR